MPGGSAKRRLKKLKRQGDEAQAIVDQLMGMFLAHNISVSFPYEIPQIVGQILAGNGQGVPNHQQAVTQANASLDRLRQLTTGGQPAHTLPGAPQQPRAPYAAPTPPTSPAAPQGDPWGDAAGAATQPFPASTAPPPPAAPLDPWGEAADAPLFDPGAPPSAQPTYEADNDEAPLSPAEMMARFEAGQARMMDRVATEGVQYKHGANGPAAGQRIAPAPGVNVPQAQGSPPAQPAAPIPVPTGAGGGKRGMNGLTPEESRAIIARATGKELKPPAANPTPKPPSM